MRLVCSRCRAILPPGSSYCPECRRLPAEEALVVGRDELSMAAMHPQNRSRAHLPIILAVIVTATGAAGSGVLYSVLHRAPRTPRQAFVEGVKSGRLATPEAFEAQCGLPAEVEHVGERTILHYSPGDRSVSFTPGHPVDLGEAAGHPERAYEWLHCGGQFE